MAEAPVIKVEMLKLVVLAKMGKYKTIAVPYGDRRISATLGEINALTTTVWDRNHRANYNERGEP
jgi:hypothetical protein